ncbi:MAG: WbuC family cupin fold metalloprotein [Balneolales bacterium]
MSQALPNITGPVFNLDEKTIEAGLEASRESKRLRMILPLHRTQDAKVQRMINFLQPGTYIQPHLHPLDHAVESILLVQGALTFFTFDDEGNVDNQYNLDIKKGTCLLDMEPRIWHNFIVTKPDTIIFEVKRGPYDPETDKTFADWAPKEGSGEAGDYLSFLERFNRNGYER